MSFNHITRVEYPDIFEDLFVFEIGETGRDHRRASNFYVNKLLEFDAENLPEHPELHGLWETDTFITDSEHGVVDMPDEAYRVEKVLRMVEEISYERVKAPDEHKATSLPVL